MFDPWTPLDPNSTSTLPIKPMLVKKPKSTAAVTKALAAKSKSNGSSSALHLNPHSSRAIAQKHVPELVHQEFAYASDLLLMSSSSCLAAGGGAQKKVGGVKRGAAAQRVLGGLMAPLDLIATAAGGGPATAGGPGGVGGGQAPLVAAGAAVFDWNDAAAQNHQARRQEEEDEEQDNGGWGGAGDDDDDDGGEGGLPLAERVGLEASDILDGIRARPLPALGEAGNGGEQSYEDLCRAHIDTMLSAAAARVVSHTPNNPSLPSPPLPSPPLPSHSVIHTFCHSGSNGALSEGEPVEAAH